MKPNETDLRWLKMVGGLKLVGGCLFVLSFLKDEEGKRVNQTPYRFFGGTVK